MASNMVSCRLASGAGVISRVTSVPSSRSRGSRGISDPLMYSAVSRRAKLILPFGVVLSGLITAALLQRVDVACWPFGGGWLVRSGGSALDGDGFMDVVDDLGVVAGGAGVFGEGAVGLEVEVAFQGDGRA